MIEVGDKEQAIKLAIGAGNAFPRQAKFFKRLEALAQLRLGRFPQAELLYSKLTDVGRADWWLMREYGQALREVGKYQEALVALSKAAQSGRKLEAMVSLFSEIGVICRQSDLKQDARNHLLLSKYIREKHGWATPEAICAGIADLNRELSDLPGPEVFDRVLAECQKFWTRTVGAEKDLRMPSLKSSEENGQRTLKTGTA